jgi:hypothetical protein
VAARLALLQAAIFAVQEIVERAAVGYPLDSLSTDRLLSIGVLVQAGVAVLVATLLVCLGRAAEAVGRALAGAPPPRPVSVVVPWPASVVRPVSRPSGVLGSRAPPALQMA